MRDSRSHRATVLLLVLVAVASEATAASQAEFFGVGSLGGEVTLGTDLSGDGRVAVGGCDPSLAQCEAWTWTQEDGLQPLGFLPFEDESFAEGASFDGTFVSGRGEGDAFRWSESLGHERISFNSNSSFGVSISDDGGSVIGNALSGASLNINAWRWRPGVGFDLVQFIPAASGGTDIGGFFTSTSADGEIITGWTGPSQGETDAFFRTGAATTPLPSLPDLGCACGGSKANGITGDGDFVVGQSQGQAVRWTSAGVILPLGFLFSGVPANASEQLSSGFDTSEDGSAIVGAATNLTTSEERALIWTEQEGMREVRAVLINSGLDLTGWQLTAAAAVSADGKTILGNGTNPQGDAEAWVAVLPGPPIVPALRPGARAALSVLLIACGLIVARTRR